MPEFWPITDTDTNFWPIPIPVLTDIEIDNTLADINTDTFLHILKKISFFINIIFSKSIFFFQNLFKWQYPICTGIYVNGS